MVGLQRSRRRNGFGGRKKWLYSKTYKSEKTSSSMTLKGSSDGASYSSAYFNRISDTGATNHPYDPPEDDEDAIPTYTTDYNLHDITIRSKSNSDLTQLYELKLYEVDTNGDIVGNSIASFRFDSSSDRNGRIISASNRSWTKNNVSNPDYSGPSSN